jgi:hypothetical protein
MPPFLHEDPAHPGQAIDWKVILVAAAYSLLAMQEQSGGNAQQSAIAKALYLYVAILVFGKGHSIDDYVRLTKAILCLLKEWCCALLYPGPVCTEDPHGVVIGCATIRGSRLVDVDPWGGRRWVVHYPLLSYWGHQFGLVPLDVFASRLFGLICCVSRLPFPTLERRLDPGSNQGYIPVANMRLYTAKSAQLNRDLGAEGVRVLAQHDVGLPEFLLKLFTNLRSPDTAAARDVEVFRLRDSPDLAFLVPVAQPSQPVVKGTAVPALVRTTAAGTRRSIPLFMRDTAENIATHLASAVPLSSAGVSEETLKKAREAKLETVGDVLDADPNRLLQVFGTAAAVNELVTASEDKVSGVTTAVFKAAAAADPQAQSPEDLQDAQRLSKYSAAILTDAVKKALKVENPQAAVNTAIESALKTK